MKPKIISFWSETSEVYQLSGPPFYCFSSLNICGKEFKKDKHFKRQKNSDYCHLLIIMVYTENNVKTLEKNNIIHTATHDFKSYFLD